MIVIVVQVLVYRSIGNLSAHIVDLSNALK